MTQAPLSTSVRHAPIARALAHLLVSSFALLGCKSAAPDEPPPSATPRPPPEQPAAVSSSAEPVAAKPATKRSVSAKPVASVPTTPDDPRKGVFSLADATKGLPGKGALTAVIDTDLGALTCALFDDKAPITVANFVGLARGLRPWKSQDGKWVERPAFDGTLFHRVVRGFMVQGGDALGTGAGDPGYVIPDEIWEGALHDRAGLLCMANRGPNTNGAQFFITDGPAPHLDNRYTIFGECTPIDTVHKLAAVEVRGERPVQPPKIKRVTVKRAPTPPASASSAAK